MPRTVRCPNCDETFQMDDEGGRAECPSCGMRFEAPKRRLSLGPGGEEDEGPTGATALLLRGSLLQIFANLLYLLGLMAMMFQMLRELDRGAGGQSETVTRLLALVLAVSLLAGWVLSAVAASFWALAPTKGMSRPLGIAVLGLSLLVLSRTDMLSVMTGSSVGRGAPFDDVPLLAYGRALLLTTYYLDAARMIVLAAYLAASARETGRASVRGPATILAIVTPVFVLGPIGLALLAEAVDKVGHEGGMVLLLLTMAGAVVAVIWGLITVFQLRGAWQRMGPASRDD